jgi:hypothetical protein
LYKNEDDFEEKKAFFIHLVLMLFKFCSAKMAPMFFLKCGSNDAMMSDDHGGA